jgi:hypothetical protein
MVLALLLCTIGLQAQLLVDCSGVNPNEFPSITAALQQEDVIGSTILVTGTCDETVNVQGLNLGVPYGQSNGARTISNSQNVYLYGLRVTNSPIDAINVNDSTAVLLEACSATGSANSGGSPP